MAKKYSGKVGVTNFYYAVLDNNDTVSGEPERIRYLQSANVEFTQEISKAYGDNTTAEIAVSNGVVNVTTGFHNVPQEDQDVIYGAETVNGVSSYGGEDNPPYIALVYQVTHNDGSSSWLGLAKGKFMRATEENPTKEESIEFGADEVSGEFMDRQIKGFSKPKSYVKGYEEAGQTDIRDEVFNMIFGTGFPGEPESTPEG
jgi:phi13 family phage major tail protein